MGCIPLFSTTVSASFASPADDYLESELDLNEHLIQRPTATFFVRVKGDCMTGSGIYGGDMVIIDRSVTPQKNDVVLAIINGEFTLKHFVPTDNGVFLCPNNKKYKNIHITDGMDFDVWGVAIHCIHKLK